MSLGGPSGGRLGVIHINGGDVRVVISQMGGGRCVLCDEEIGVGDSISLFPLSWSHSECVRGNVLTRTIHTDGYTYFLELEDGAVKIGFTLTRTGIKDRIRKTHNFIHPVSGVLGVMDGGASLEALMHITFEGLADGRVETFRSAEDLINQARQGASHEMVKIGNDFLVANKHKWQGSVS